MSHMEVDFPPLNGLADSIGPNGRPTDQKVVQFSEVDDIQIFQQEIDMRPKQKVARRMRIPAALPPLTSSTGGADSSPASPRKPQSPAKLKKLAEKDRHSRTGRRGMPKKGGAGGKGTWGKLTDMYDEEGLPRDAGDPNYDSVEEEESYVTPSSPEMSPDHFQKHAQAVFKEYFEHGDTREVEASLQEYNIRNMKHEIVHVLVTLAMEEKAAHRELASQLVSFLYGHILNSRDVALAFDALLVELSELSLDTPDASEVLGNFIARCIADDCLPPAYLHNHHDVVETHAAAALKRAGLLLSMKHGIARLDNVWGVGGGQRPVVHLTNKMVLLLKEYLSSGDLDEAVRCLSELEVPHFHHEVVYQAVLLVLEDGSDHCITAMTALLQHMAQITIISIDQMEQGFIRVFGSMTDIVLDAPAAYTTLIRVVESGTKAGFVTPLISQEIPQRGRKRFVSEGDGGAIKPPEP